MSRLPLRFLARDQVIGFLVAWRPKPPIIEVKQTG